MFLGQIELISINISTVMCRLFFVTLICSSSDINITISEKRNKQRERKKEKQASSGLITFVHLISLYLFICIAILRISALQYFM